VKQGGDQVTIIDTQTKNKVELNSGNYELELQGDKPGLRLSTEKFTLKRGDRTVVTVSREPAPESPSNEKPPAAPRPTVPAPTPEDWANTVFHLPVQEQVRAVSARLKELNPGFDGRVEVSYRDGAVYSLSFCTDAVKDISPVQSLRELGRLSAIGSERHRGRLADLGPLRGLRKLGELDVSNNDVQSLEPLKGIPLLFINIGFDPVHDLKPLSGMPLEVLRVWDTNVGDLSPLARMPLRELNLTGIPVRDLSPLKDMPLEALFIGWTNVVDLSPLKGLPLKVLAIDQVNVNNLEPVKGAQLREFHYKSSSIREISVLRGMPLEVVTCDFQPERDAATLRSIATLRTINGKPAADFWKEFDARPVPAKPRREKRG
jgi:Leucine-rich repeat (LRR) protein